MKYLQILCIVAFISMTSAGRLSSHPRGCIWAMGRCIRECEVGTHSYSTGCSQKMPEATCDQPIPEKEKYIICDFSACYCDPPTVRDTASGKCVPLEQCPPKQ